MPETSDLIGTAEASRILGIEKTTLTRWVADGRVTAEAKLPGKNGAFLFNRSEIVAYAAESRSAATPVAVSQ